MSERESGAVLVDALGGLLPDPTNELKFQLLFNNVTVELRISNPTEKRIASKIKTSAAECYTVQPNRGVLDPSQSATVNVKHVEFYLFQKEFLFSTNQTFLYSKFVYR
jgi:hypothetical protein